MKILLILASILFWSAQPAEAKRAKEEAKPVIVAPVPAIDQVSALTIWDSSGTQIVSLLVNGTIVPGPTYRPDSASIMFWSAVGNNHPYAAVYTQLYQSYATLYLQAQQLAEQVKDLKIANTRLEKTLGKKKR